MLAVLSRSKIAASSPTLKRSELGIATPLDVSKTSAENFSSKKTSTIFPRQSPFIVNASFVTIFSGSLNPPCEISRSFRFRIVMLS